MAEKNISNQEVKGTKDWFPEEFNIRKYIFDKWRQVCLSYGFSEYLSPLLEQADIYRAKSGEDVGAKELMIFVDQGGRELAIRPEMTPSIVRMVSKIYASAPKPLKLFSIANFIRNEKPQRGRNREFWQLNCDIFGDKNYLSDLEILRLSIDLVLSFGAPQDSFIVKISHRGLIESLFDIIKVAEDKKLFLTRLLDKSKKIKADVFVGEMEELGLNTEQIDKIIKFISATSLSDLGDKIPEIKNCSSFNYLENIFVKLKDISYVQYAVFSPEIIRGFDYYDGIIFEVFDKHPNNNRAMFGGGRYNGLASIFNSSDFPAVGFAPGDETFKLFLESWNLLPEINIKKDSYFLPILQEDLEKDAFLLAQKMRQEGKRVDLGLGLIKLAKALEYADKNGIGFVVVLGSEEKEKGIYKIKDMASGQESIFKIE